MKVLLSRFGHGLAGQPQYRHLVFDLRTDIELVRAALVNVSRSFYEAAILHLYHSLDIEASQLEKFPLFRQ